MLRTVAPHPPTPRLAAAALAILLAPCGAITAAAQTVWTDVVNATASGSTIEKTSGCTTCPDAGGRSAAEISAGDGSVEFTPSYGHRFYAGLGNDKTAGTDAAQIDFAFSFWTAGTWDIRENNVYRTEGTYAAGDVFKIAIESGVVKYYRNGVVVYTSAVAPSYPLVLDTTLVTLGSRVENANLTGAPSTTGVVWTSIVNAAASGSTLQKTSGCDGCPDAGGTSQQQLSGDGRFEFTPSWGHRQYAGLGNDTSGSTDPAQIDFAFSFWSGGTWDIRENNVYRTEGSYAAGDIFGIAVESGVVQYYHNGSVVYTSAVAPTFPLVADATMLTSGSTLSSCTITDGTGGGSQTTYTAPSDRTVRTEPALPSLGPAGTAITDPSFGSRILRVTDGMTRPGHPDRSYRSPSAGHQNAWSADGRYFYVVSTDGTVVPFAFDSEAGAASRLQSSSTGEGGVILKFRNEPQFSYVRQASMYGNYNGSGVSPRWLYEYDVSTDAYTPLLNLDDVVAGLADTYVGGISSSAGPVEKISVFFGGAQQDQHYYMLVFERANPANRTLVDTLASTIDGVPTNITLNFRLHSAYLDRSGRYAMLSPTGPDRQAPRNAAPLYVWDLETDIITEIPQSALIGAHEAPGYGQLVNQGCCRTTTWDAAQWQFRSLAAPTETRDLISPVLEPKEVYLADHISWHNAKADAQMPFISGLFRYGDNTVEWRAWDDEIVAIQTDVPPGGGAIVWRFAHHRSNVAKDNDPLKTYFWYMPRPNVSHDGRWAIFTSNWEKTLGVDPRGEAGGQYRQDVFLLKLR